MTKCRSRRSPQTVCVTGCRPRGSRSTKGTEKRSDGNVHLLCHGRGCQVKRAAGLCCCGVAVRFVVDGDVTVKDKASTMLRPTEKQVMRVDHLRLGNRELGFLGRRRKSKVNEVMLLHQSAVERGTLTPNFPD